MRVLVTGAAGFIGSHVVDALVAEGWEVRGVDLLVDTSEHLNPGAEYRRLDLRDESAISDASKGVHAVSHQASRVGLERSFSDAPEYVSNNSLGTAVLLQALCSVGFTGRLVLAGSMVVYGEGAYACSRHGACRPAPRSRARLQAGIFEPQCPECGGDLEPRPVTEDHSPDPRNVYAATKLNQEHLCTSWGRETGAVVSTLRYHNVYGPRMPRDTRYAGVAGVFVCALESGRAPIVFEDGAQLRDFVHVSDVARANVAALSAPSAVRGALNIASGAPHSVGELAGCLAAAAGAGAPRPRVTGDYRMGDVRHVFGSPRRAHEALGFEARVPFEVGARDLAPAPSQG